MVRISICRYVFCLPGSGASACTCTFSSTSTRAIDAAHDEKQDGEDDQADDDCDWNGDLEVLFVPCGGGILP